MDESICRIYPAYRHAVQIFIYLIKQRKLAWKVLIDILLMGLCSQTNACNSYNRLATNKAPWLILGRISQQTTSFAFPTIRITAGYYQLSKKSLSKSNEQNIVSPWNALDNQTIDSNLLLCNGHLTRTTVRFYRACMALQSLIIIIIIIIIIKNRRW